MTPAAAAVAESVLRSSGREHPADAVLRQTLKERARLSAIERRQVSEAVFAYFRWLGWLDAGSPLRQRVQCAISLACRFKERPFSFSNDELVSRSVPTWVRSEIPLSPELARAYQTEPTLWLRSRSGKAEVLAQTLNDAHVFGRGSLTEAVRYSGNEDLFRTQAFHDGEFELQDLSSQAVGVICAPQPGQTWWDACAGEGGKTLHLSDLMRNRGLIWATDRAAWRLSRLRRRAARAKVFNFRTAAWDGSAALPTRTVFDGVLVDATCSGTGTWQRNPHARWAICSGDIDELREVQLKLLLNASAAVKTGGRLIYAVCSITAKETIWVADRFLRESPRFSPVAVSDPFTCSEVRSGQLLFLPQTYGGNGMFVASWRRTG